MDSSAFAADNGDIIGPLAKPLEPIATRGAEHRRESRVILNGTVRLQFLGGGVHAELMDVSNNGFRAAHVDPRLSPGCEVRFEHRFFVGRAEVVWTQRIAGRLQSGFRVIRN